MSDLRDQLQAALGDAYVIDRELGGDGATRVFAATEGARGRRVVVKVIAPEHEGELFADRFAREVKFAARLQQENIVPLLTAGVVGEHAYYVAPFVEGQSLRSRLAGGSAIPVAEGMGILRDVARALAYAHDVGVVHRDIRPENIRLSSGTAVVTDFGVAKAMSASRTMEISIDGSSALPATLTSAGSTIGTPAYMSPEQAAGSVADPRSDLYAWGVVAYEVLAGAHPFSGHETPQAMLAAHLTERPTPLEERVAGVPSALAHMVMRCLEKDADDRPGSAEELLAGLEGRAPTPPANEVIRRRRSGQEVPTVVVEADDTSDVVSRRMGVAAALLILALVLWGWFSRQADRGAQPSIAPSQDSAATAAPAKRP